MIAYLLIVHAATEQLSSLVDVLRGDARSRVFVHLDARAGSAAWLDAAAASGALTLVPRVAVHWGGFSMIEATRNLLRAALAEPDATRFVLLSGSCWPVRPMREVNDRLAAMDDADAVALWELVSDPRSKIRTAGGNAVEKFHCNDIPLLNPSKGRIRHVLIRLAQRINIRLPYRRFSDGPVVKGSQWFAVGRAAAEDFVAPRPALDRYFRYSFAPDETFFQTLHYRALVSAGHTPGFVPQRAALQALHFIGNRDLAARAIRERVNRIDRRQLDIGDVPAILMSDALFARKCTPEVCRALAAAGEHRGAAGKVVRS